MSPSVEENWKRGEYNREGEEEQEREVTTRCMRGCTTRGRRTGNERRKGGYNKDERAVWEYNKRTREEEREQDMEETLTKQTRKYTHVRGQVEYRIAGKANGKGNEATNNGLQHEKNEEYNKDGSNLKTSSTRRKTKKGKRTDRREKFTRNDKEVTTDVDGETEETQRSTTTREEISIGRHTQLERSESGESTRCFFGFDFHSQAFFCFSFEPAWEICTEVRAATRKKVWFGFLFDWIFV